MDKLLIGYFAAANAAALLLTGIDKRRAINQKWRIPEKTLFLTALLGGSIGALVGMYLFRHKTRHLRFTIGIPAILTLQLLLLIGLSVSHRERVDSPTSVVERELSLITKQDAETLDSFLTFEDLGGSALITSDPDISETVRLFFHNFQYHLFSEETTDDTAIVIGEIINIDARDLASDLCRTLIARGLDLNPDLPSPQRPEDYYAILRDTLAANTYSLTATPITFRLARRNHVWTILADEDLQNQLVGGFISYMNDPYLLSPEDVLSVCLDEFCSLSPEGWIEYLGIDDIFSTHSSYAASIDQAYAGKIAEYFSWRTKGAEVSGDTAKVSAVITSVDMPHVLSVYKSRLLQYAGTTESITSDEETISDTSAVYLLDALTDDACPCELSVTVTLTNNGRSWQPEFSEEVTNAFLGNISEALERFQSP